MSSSEQQQASAAGQKAKKSVHKLNPRLREKLKTKLKKGDETLTAEEKQRRQEQKKRRALALKLRAEGRTYSNKTFNSKKRKQEWRASESIPKRRAGTKAKLKIKSGQRDKAPYQVIILPIAWHQRKEEAARILAAAEAAQALLEGDGITCRIDDTDKYTPGQKMKYWELRGVRVRLEIGPKESLASSAVLAVAAGAPGEVAQKCSVKVQQPALSARIRAALKQLGEAVPEAAGAAAAAAADGEQEPAAGGEQDGKQQKKKRKQPAAAADEEAQEQQEQPKRHKKAKEPKLSQAEQQAAKDALKQKLRALVTDADQAGSIADSIIQQEAGAGGGGGGSKAAAAPAAAKPQQQHGKKQKQQQRVAPHESADALEDDFDFDLAAADAAAAGGKKKQQHKQVKHRRERPTAAVDGGGAMAFDAAWGAGGGGGGGGEAGKKQRKAKVVKF